MTVEWPGGDEHAETAEDGWFRICGIPTGKLLLIKASRDHALATASLTLAAGEIVHPLSIQMAP